MKVFDDSSAPVELSRNFSANEEDKPPTLKDSNSLPIPSEKPERASETSASGTDSSSVQPVALEVPVTVNGARAVEGSDKREPFSETTTTVLVLANGAVIRLSSSVA